MSAVSLEFPSELFRWSPDSSGVLDFDLFRCFCDWRPPECHRTAWPSGLPAELKIDEQWWSLSGDYRKIWNSFQPLTQSISYLCPDNCFLTGPFWGDNTFCWQMKAMTVIFNCNSHLPGGLFNCPPFSVLSQTQLFSGLFQKYRLVCLDIKSKTTLATRAIKRNIQATNDELRKESI